MEEKKQELAKRETSPSFIEKLMLNSESLEEIKKIGEIIIASGFCPDHFKTSKDAVGVIMCIEAGRQLGLTWMQSLSDLYPVKGRIGMMGASARALIFSSGVLDKWEERTEGNYPDDNYKHIIVSKRKGLPGEFHSEFSVYDAKKAGLFQKDIYQRYGKRLIMWRNIGFHATDYYGDVMKGMKTVEELNDYDGNIDDPLKKSIQTDAGEIKTDFRDVDKSKTMTSRAAEKIGKNKFEKPDPIIQDAVIVDEKNFQSNAPESNNPAYAEKINEIAENESPFKAEKGSVAYMDGKVVAIDGENENENENENANAKEGGHYTLKELEGMETKVLLEMINADSDMIEAMELIPGKNTNRKLRGIIFAKQNGTLPQHIADYLGEDKEIASEPQQGNESSGAEIPVNKEFEKQGTKVNTFMDEPQQEGGNKYNLTVPVFDKGNQRDFASTKTLYNMLAGVNPPIDNTRYLTLAGAKGWLGKYADKEAFAKFASVQEVDELLNSN
jgi:hypothetical protein